MHFVNALNFWMLRPPEDQHPDHSGGAGDEVAGPTCAQQHTLPRSIYHGPA